MPNSTPISLLSKTSRWPLVAPASFRQAALYRVRGMKSKLRRRTVLRAVAEQGLVFSQRKANPANLLFRYLYCDASNYKQQGEAIFTNRTFLSESEIEKQIRACLKDGEFFIARQVNLEERFFNALRDDDHPWHTFERLEVTTLAPFDPDNWAGNQHRRDITEFIADLERAHQAGWDEMNVRPDLQRLLEQQKAAIRKDMEK